MLVRQALKTAIASTVLAGIFQHSDLAHIQYPAMGLVATMLSSNLGDVVRAGWGRLGGSAVAGVVSAVVISTWGANPLTASIAFVLSTVLCEAFQWKALTNQAGAVAVLIAADPDVGKESWRYIFDRVVDNSIGVIVAILVTILFWPDNPRQILKDNLVKVLQNCDQIFQAIIENILREESSSVETIELLTKTEEILQQSEILLGKSMYGVVGEQLTRENWSAPIANSRNLIRHLSAMVFSFRENRQNQILHNFTEELRQLIRQVSAESTAIITIIQSREATTRSANNFLILENSLQKITERLNQMRTRGETKKYILKDFIQFYSFLHVISSFTQDIERMKLEFLNRKGLASQTSNRWFLKFQLLTNKQVKHIFKTGIAVGLSITIVDIAKLPFGYYAAIAVAIIMQPTLGKSIDAGRQRIICTAIGAIVAILTVNILGSHSFTVGIGVGLTILICSYFGFNQGYKPGCFLVIVAIMVYSSEPISYVWGRFYETFLGFAIALMISFLFWPETASQNLDPSISQTFIKMGKLYETVVNQYLQGLDSGVVIERLSEEIRQSINSHSLLQAETKLESIDNLTASKTQKKWNLLLSYEKTLLGNIIDFQYAARQGNSAGFLQHFASEIQASANATVLAFNDLAAAVGRENSLRKFSNPSQTFDIIFQKLEQLRSEGTSLQYSLDDIITFFSVLSSMKEIAENLNQIQESRT